MIGMADESLADRIDIAESLDLDDGGEGDESGVGERLGGAIGASVGRRIGTIVGARLIDDLLLDRPSGPADEEASEGDRSTGDGEADADSEEATAPDDSPDDDTTEAESDGPERIEDLEELSYRELQSLAKDVDVRANLAREEMTEQIAEALDLDD